MKPEGSSPYSHVPVTCPFPEQARFSPYPTSHFLKIHLNMAPIYAWVSQVVSFPGFPNKTLYTSLLSPIRATCPAQLILLDFITRTILGEQYRSFSSSLCSFLHSSVTSCLLGPNIIPQRPIFKHPQPAFLTQFQ